MRTWSFLALFWILIVQANQPWVVYYQDQATAKEFIPYDPIVLDARTHPLLVPLIEKDKELLGYINMAEVEEIDEWFHDVKSKKLIIAKNPHWIKTWSVDIRDPFWKDLIITKIAPDIIAQGFSGFFLDQIDVALNLELKNPKTYQGMKKAACQLVEMLRKKFPEKKIMMNRAYEILEDVGSIIDYELAETLYTLYDFEKKTYTILMSSLKDNFKIRLDLQLFKLIEFRQKKSLFKTSIRHFMSASKCRCGEAMWDKSKMV